MIRRPPRSTLDRSSAASDVYKRQGLGFQVDGVRLMKLKFRAIFDDDDPLMLGNRGREGIEHRSLAGAGAAGDHHVLAVSYTHLRAHETVLDLVCRLLLDTKQHPLRASAHHC